jgi:hypothetical protein
MVSLDALIEHLEVDGARPSGSEWDVDPERLLHVPQELVSEFDERIDCLDAQVDRVRLRELLGLATTREPTNPNRAIFEVVFGDALPDLLRQAVHDEAPPALPSGEALPDSEDPKESALRYLGGLGGEPEALAILGEGPDLGFQVEVVTGSGFGEYWPQELIDADRDRLVLFMNDDSRKLRNFLTTLRHEVYPGHGHFYKKMRQRRPKFFDHGAMALIEGWATWSEWGVAGDEFGKYTRATRMRSLRYFDRSDVALGRDLAAGTIENGYSEGAARASVKYFFQYPGFGYSYTLGALWFERFLTERSVASFFDGLDYWGDFFAIWET